MRSLKEKLAEGTRTIASLNAQNARASANVTELNGEIEKLRDQLSDKDDATELLKKVHEQEKADLLELLKKVHEREKVDLNALLEREKADALAALSKEKDDELARLKSELEETRLELEQARQGTNESSTETSSSSEWGNPKLESLWEIYSDPNDDRAKSIVVNGRHGIDLVPPQPRSAR